MRYLHVVVFSVMDPVMDYNGVTGGREHNVFSHVCPSVSLSVQKSMEEGNHA